MVQLISLYQPFEWFFGFKIANTIYKNNAWFSMVKNGTTIFYILVLLISIQKTNYSLCFVLFTQIVPATKQNYGSTHIVDPNLRFDSIVWHRFRKLVLFWKSLSYFIHTTQWNLINLENFRYIICLIFSYIPNHH